MACFLTAGLAGTFYGYSQKETLDTTERHVFNFFMTGFVIAVTANLTSSTRSYVQVLRWRLLAATSLSLAEVDLAMDCASQTKTFEASAFLQLEGTEIGTVTILVRGMESSQLRFRNRGWLTGA